MAHVLRGHFASAKWAGDPSAVANGLEILRMRLALYEPDIPQNAGTILRLAACLGVAVDVIQPTGFDMTDRALRRAGLDYLAHVEIDQHQSFAAFDAVRRSRGSRLVLLTTRGAVAYTDFAFVQMIRCCLAGRAPVCRRLCTPSPTPACASRCGPDLRSLNVAVAAAMVLGEALRQTGGFSAAESPRLR